MGVSFSQWEFVKEENGISVFQKKLPGYSTPAFKAEMNVGSSEKDAFSVLERMERYTDWLPLIKSIQILEEETNTTIAYVTVDAPWPLKDRDGYFRYTFHPESYELEVTALANYRPIHNKFVRIKQSNSSWKIEKATNGQTRVTYQSHTELDKMIPQWLIKSQLVKIPILSLTGFSKEVEKK